MAQRGPSFIGTIVLVFASMAGLFAFDTFLAKVELKESQAEGRRLYHDGERSLEQGQVSEAIESFRAALTFERGNTAYQLALARALLAAKKPADAETVVDALLQHDATDGATNLTMARTMVAQGRLDDASSYYHRALYGRWPAQAELKQRLQVRLELIDLLAREGNKEDLLAELLPLETEALDPKTREHIAHLYLEAGSANRASDMFREILRHNASDADAYAGLGEAEFTRGNYRIAHANLQRAASLKPQNAEFQRMLKLVSDVLELDPTIRGLGSRERLQRSTRILSSAVQSVTKCAGTTLASEVQPLVDKAQQALSATVRPGQENDTVNANLDLAEKIWQLRKKICKQPIADEDQAVALVLAKIAQ